MTVIWDEAPKARIHHTCSSCGRTINPDEIYRRTRIVGEDGPFTDKRCEHCSAFVKLYIEQFCPDPYEGWLPEDIEEWHPNTDIAREHKRQWLIGWKHGRDFYPVPTAEAKG